MTNRKPLFTLLFASITAFVLCFAIAGCSSGGNDNNAAFVGKWNLESLKYPSGTEYVYTQLEQMDMDYSITLNADVTAEYKITNMDVDVTWKADSPTSDTEYPLLVIATPYPVHQDIVQERSLRLRNTLGLTLRKGQAGGRG